MNLFIIIAFAIGVLAYTSLIAHIIYMAWSSYRKHGGKPNLATCFYGTMAVILILFFSFLVRLTFTV